MRSHLLLTPRRNQGTDLLPVLPMHLQQGQEVLMLRIIPPPRVSLFPLRSLRHPYLQLLTGFESSQSQQIPIIPLLLLASTPLQQYLQYLVMDRREDSEQRDYRLKVENCFLDQREMEEEKQTALSHVSQFNFFKKKIQEAIDIIFPERQERVYSAFVLLSRIWKNIHPSKPNVLQFERYRPREEIREMIEKMQKWEGIFSKCFQLILGKEFRAQIKFPIQANEAKQAKRFLDGILAGNLKMTVGLSDIAMLIKEIDKVSDQNPMQGVYLLIRNTLLKNREIEKETHLVTSTDLLQLEKGLENIEKSGMLCNKLEIDVNIVKSITQEEVMKDTKTLKVQRSDYAQKKEFERLDQEYRNSESRVEEQLEIALRMEILYANIIHQYYDMFKDTQGEAQSVIYIGDAVQQLAGRLNKTAIDFSLRYQIDMIGSEIKRESFKNFRQVQTKEQLQDQSYHLTGDSKEWILNWKRNNITYLLSSKPQNKEDQDFVIYKLESEKNRNLFRENLGRMYARLEENGFKEKDLMKYNDDLHRIFIFIEAGKGMQKVLGIKDEQKISVYKII